MNKQTLIQKIVTHLGQDMETAARSARSAHAEATDEQSKAENKYDTRGLEAAYLARGQSRQAAENAQAIELFSTLPLRVFGAADAIDLGAVVEVEGGGESTLYFIGPRAGGMEVRNGKRDVMVITPQSPLGRELMGRKAGDRWPAKIGARAEEFHIVSVQ